MTIMKEIQQKLKAPKDQTNDFGGFSYRNAEGILESIKPILDEYDAYLNITDDIVACGDRVYVKATATVYHDNTAIGSSSGFAREQFEKKGMDMAQITGAASSYARKYALNGLFGIDDTKDADSNEYQQGQGDEIKDPQHRFKKGEREELVKQLKDAAYNGNKSHIDEIFDEQPNSAIMKIWSDFTAAERTAIKDLRGKTDD